jgi:ATP-dependent DNA ligase
MPRISKVRLCANDVGGLKPKAWQQVLEHGWEGYVAKDPESRYVGGRSLKWLRVKQPDYRVEERGWETKP